MVRGVQASKMGKRKRRTQWGAEAKKKPKYTKSFTLSKSDYGFPDKFRTRLRYCDTIQFTAAGGAAQANTFRLNSIYDPDLSGSGHQPMYHDTLALIYGKYRVLGARIKVDFAMRSPPTLAGVEYGPTVVGVITSANNSLQSSGSNQLLEQNNNSVKILGDKGGSAAVVTCYQEYKPWRDIGNGQIDDTSASSFGNNPAQVFHAHIFKNDSGTASAAVTAYVTIEYEVEVFQRLEAATS